MGTWEEAVLGGVGEGGICRAQSRRREANEEGREERIKITEREGNGHS